MAMKKVLLAVVAVVAVAAGALGLWLYSSLPDLAGRVEVLAGLAAPVEITRDSHGVPRIVAASPDDAYFALGYVHAQDRLWQMEATRRLAAGRLAEVLGERALASDRFMRVMGFQRLVERQWLGLAADTRRAFEAYAAGVNGWMDGHWGALPPEFLVLGFTPEPWRPTDSLLWPKLMGPRLSGNWRTELLRARLASRLSPKQIADLWPPYPADGPVTVQTAELWRDLPLDQLAQALPALGQGASNAWAVDGSRTKSGKPLLANDPHLGFSVPILWYLASLEAPGLKVTGATVPGMPFTIIGHNDRIAWGFTATQSDLQDLFVERLDPADPGRYRTPDGSLPFSVREETIAVRGEADHQFSVRETRHGPVISDLVEFPGSDDGRVLALAATYLRQDDRTPQAILRLNQAGGWDDVVAAVADFHAPQQNLTYADVDGNIGFITPGRVPIRRGGRGRTPVPGWTGEADWTGFVPQSALPRVLNPADGRIVNANNPVIPDDYPYFISESWAAPYRARRISGVLAADGPPRDAEAMARVQSDSLSLMVPHLLPLIGDIQVAGEGARRALALLLAWDGRMDRNRPEPLIFHTWLRELNRRVYADELGPFFESYWTLRPQFIARVFTERQGWCDDTRTTRTETCRGLAAAALTRTVAELSHRFEPDMAAWRWGAVHRARFKNQILAAVPLIGGLTTREIESDGGPETVNRGTGRISDEDAPFAHVHGAGLRVIMDLANLSRSRFMIATGQSGNPLSTHYDDLLEAWRDGQYLFPSGPAAETAEILRLIPAD